MPAYSFSEEFIELIHQGRVKSAILPTSQGALPGMHAYFFESGVHNLVASSTVLKVTPISVGHTHCVIDDVALPHDEVDVLAKNCGFQGYTAMVEFFKDQFRLPFKGFLHTWA